MNKIFHKKFQDKKFQKTKFSKKICLNASTSPWCPDDTKSRL